MFELAFWFLFLLAYAGFSLWLAKTILLGIFLAVSTCDKAKQPAVAMWAGGREVETSERRLDQTIEV